jgi:hydroxymethylpyrimidine/phosphomethylpyrimidine kinase
MPEVAEALRDLGPRGVLLKGGHLGGDASDDVYVDADGLVELPAARIDTPHTHGTGCTLSSAVAALRPRHRTTVDAVREARAYVLGAILHAGALSVGGGHGPVHHFHDLWTPTPA